MAFTWKMSRSRLCATPFEQKYAMLELKASPVTLSSAVAYIKTPHERLRASMMEQKGATMELRKGEGTRSY
jgi:hypothetical protein